TLGRPHAVALHFTRCDQLVAGLPPAGMRPCRAHDEKPRSRRGSLGIIPYRDVPFRPGSRSPRAS
ncbi:hypothetical protein CN065_28670, partial [Sinorhizobium meliloti]